MTLKAALYARVSSDKSDKTSCDQQLRICREFAASEGFEVAAEYRDDYITGTDDQRPGWLALHAACERLECDVVIADESSRLSRNEHAVPRFLEQLAFRDQFLLTADGRMDSRNDNCGIVNAVEGSANASELKKIARRVKRGQRQRFDEGLNTGGKAYGYKSVPLFPGDPDNRRARREIHPEQAAIVQRIFRDFAAGDSERTIAGALNADGVPSPGAQWERQTRRKDAKWLGSGVRAMLDNAVYHGEVIFNRYEWRKVPGTRKRQCRARPEDQWLRRQAPELRIVPEELWAKVRARRAAQRERSVSMETRVRSYAKGTGIKDVITQSRGGRPNRYLLSGILKCESCGCSLIIADQYRYACGSHVGGKQAACAHSRRYVRTHVEETLLELIAGMFTAQHEERFRKRLVSNVAAASRVAAGSDPAARIAALSVQIDRCVAAIVDGLDSPALRAKLRDAEAERARLTTAPAPRIAPARLVTDAGARFRAIVGDLRGRLGGSPERGREVLGQLVGTVPVAPDGIATVTLNERHLLSLVSNGKNTDGSGGRI